MSKNRQTCIPVQVLVLDRYYYTRKRYVKSRVGHHVQQPVVVNRPVGEEKSSQLAAFEGEPSDFLFHQHFIRVEFLAALNDLSQLLVSQVEYEIDQAFFFVVPEDVVEFD